MEFRRYFFGQAPVSQGCRSARWSSSVAIDSVRKQIEKSVRYANITIIEGNEASQFGIGIVSARIASQSVVITVGLAAGASRQNRQTILSKRSIASKSGAFRRLGEFDLPADPHTGNFLSPIIRHDNEGSIPAVVLRQFPGNNESVRRSIVDAGKDRSGFVWIPDAIDDV